MTENKRHLVSAFDRSENMVQFCESINFTRDATQAYFYRVKEGIEQGEEIRKKCWHRVSEITDSNDSNNILEPKNYKEEEWDEDGESCSEVEGVVNLRSNTAYWLFGRKGESFKWRSQGKGSGQMNLGVPLLISLGDTYYHSSFTEVILILFLVSILTQMLLTFSHYMKTLLRRQGIMLYMSKIQLYTELN